MDFRKLGRTDLNVSSICLGTMTWGEQNTEAEGHAQMDVALEQGINFFDTAELYAIPPKPETKGRTEEIIGTWFKKTGNRDKVVLATKVVGRSVQNWHRKDGSDSQLSRTQIMEAVDCSLQRLQTDYIDLYQIHWPDRNVSSFGSVSTIWQDVERVEDENAIHETLEVMQELVKAGKIRHFGLSNESPWGTMKFVQEAEARGLPRVQSIQNAYSLVNRLFEVGGAEIAHREDVGLLAYSALAQGYLTGKYLNGALPAGARKTLFKRLGRYETDGGQKAVAAYCALAAELGIDPSVMALAFAHSRSFVTSVIIGATSQAQLMTDIGAADFKMTAEIEEKINQIHLQYTNPCP
ncbi:General stress protein 69 [Pseudovibrio axinellae]|uniref:Protein tas n=1 Tax=Pseudovibrio axinellae TaxID=989403 RepID=A0A165WY52_9HYPH|nr:aldo/keto reductase [Pseudovibrio axinellae]KZL17029.1 General stress protein 69 [Pseudovibrio axinellae]SEQ16773.1 Predicted oxidoreductase [Pseudovibrio axinellae]